MRKVLSQRENKLVYEDFNSAVRKMRISQIAFNLAQQELDEKGKHEHDKKYFKVMATILYDDAKKLGL